MQLHVRLVRGRGVPKAELFSTSKVFVEAELLGGHQRPPVANGTSARRRTRLLKVHLRPAVLARAGADSFEEHQHWRTLGHKLSFCLAAVPPGHECCGRADSSSAGCACVGSHEASWGSSGGGGSGGGADGLGRYCSSGSSAGGLGSYGSGRAHGLGRLGCSGGESSYSRHLAWAAELAATELRFSIHGKLTDESDVVMSRGSTTLSGLSADGSKHTVTVPMFNCCGSGAGRKAGEIEVEPSLQPTWRTRALEGSRSRSRSRSRTPSCRLGRSASSVSTCSDGNGSSHGGSTCGGSCTAAAPGGPGGGSCMTRTFSSSSSMGTGAGSRRRGGLTGALRTLLSPLKSWSQRVVGAP